MQKIALTIGFLCLAGLVYRAVTPRRRRARRKLLLSFNFDSITFKSNSMAVSFFPGQTVTGTLQPVDRKGNPSNVESGSTKFTSSDESVFTVSVDPDNELSVVLTAVGPGVAQLDFSADADLDEGDGEIKQISGFAAVEVLPEEAVGFGAIQFSEPADPATV